MHDADVRRSQYFLKSVDIIPNTIYVAVKKRLITFLIKDKLINLLPYHQQINQIVDAREYQLKP